MRRRRLRRVLLIGVLTALGGIAYLVSSSVSARLDAVRVVADLLPQVAQRIQNFRRIKVKDGRTVWEITADDAQYFEDDNQIIVHEPRLTFFLKDGARWATGGRAVFDQANRTLVLSENPMLHDGANEVGGDRVIVYLDEDRSVVEGGRKRVKAILHPDREEKADGMDQAQKKADARQTAVEAAR